MSGKDNFLLDTNAVLGFLNGNAKISAFFRTHLTNKTLYISQITRMELLGYPQITSEEEACLIRFLSLIKILPLNEAVCDQAIILRRKNRLKLPDALIAATAVHFDLVLITCDMDLLGTIEKLQSLNPA